MQSNQTKHYPLLDGARGIAALAIVLYHLITFVFVSISTPAVDGFLKHSFLAVDLFFLMSGVVVAAAYEHKLLTGALTFSQFCAVRLIRLWPLYLAGLVLGLSFALVKSHLQPLTTPSMGEHMTSFVRNIFFIPDVAGKRELFNLNPPAWSLFLEFFVNLLYAALVAFLTTRRLLLVVVAAAIGLWWRTHAEPSLNMGWGYDTLAEGVLRILFAFPLGVVMYRALKHTTVQVPAAWAPVWLMGLLLMLATPFGGYSTTYEFLCIFVVVPVMVLLLCLTQTPVILLRSCAWLGAVSYAIYILHVPILFWCAGAYKAVTKLPIDTHAPIAMPLVVVVILVATTLMCRWDENLRRKLRLYLLN